jgi:hypothetical protein
MSRKVVAEVSAQDDDAKMFAVISERELTEALKALLPMFHLSLSSSLCINILKDFFMQIIPLSSSARSFGDGLN